MLSHDKVRSLFPALLLALFPGTVRATAAEYDTVGPVPAKYSPWTHVPVCDVSAADPDRKYCVYTNSRHGKRGLSVLAKPEVATDNVGILNEYLDFSGNDGPFKIVDIPGKGKGVVATRHIKRYEQIMADYAALLIDVSFATEVPAENGYKLLQVAVNQLADPESVLALGQSNDMANNPIENVLRTNAFHSVLGEEPHMALYPLVSMKLIKLDITLGKTTAARREALKLWGFECQCSLCTAPAAEIAQSDARREQIEQLRDQAIDAFQAGRAYQALRITRQIINLIPTEELFPMYAEQYENMARIYFVLRDQENAVKYAKMSLDVLKEQGYIDRVKPEHFGIMWRRFAAEEEGRY
ncbi:hypothetical protein OQA88_1296 [Cercophora sp. LCS_1]